MKYKNVTYDSFSGRDAEACNALLAAFAENAGGKDRIYEWLEETPKTTMVVLLVDKLKEIGYEIKPTE